MKYATVCTGIGAPELAFNSLGWESVWMSEIAKFPCAVLAHHYPSVPNLGDMTTIHESEVFKNESVDLIIGGTPCQSFSVAGLRKGMGDLRGNLALVYLSILDRARPRWMVWENVPGVLSSNAGRDFGSFLGGLAKIGYGFAYRVLDAQYFGLAQRRKRVFVVGCLGNWQAAAAVLFERASLCGYPAPLRKTRASVAETLEMRTSDHGVEGSASGYPQVAGTLTEGYARRRGSGLAEAAANGQVVADTLRSDGNGGIPSSRGENIVCMATGQASAETISDGSPSLTCNHEAPIICFNTTQITSAENGSNPQPGDPCHTIAAQAHPPAVAIGFNGDQSEKAYSMGEAASQALVRRLTPRECERLQGFPDDFTLIPWRGKKVCPDGPRYTALGNSMAVPVVRWIGERIDIVDNITKGETDDE